MSLEVKDFSVSMCVYGKDNPDWLKKAVESVMNQSVKPAEIVLVVDGPVPNELDRIIRKYECNEIFNIKRFAENRGHGEARRAGLETCKHNLVALMDADDVCVNDRFEQQLEIFEKYDIDIVGGNIAEFVETTENIVAYRNVPETDSDIKEYMKKRCPFNQMTVMFKKSSVQRAGGYIDWYCDEDYYLWLRMAQNNCIMMNTGTVLVNARVGEDMYNRRGGVRYFKSEVKLQKFMYDEKIINKYTLVVNCMKRLIVQLLLPNQVRSWAYKKFAREKL